MALIKADRAESLFKEFGLHNREACDVVGLCFEEKRSSHMVDDGSTDLGKSGGWGLMGNRAVTPAPLQQGEFSRGRVKTVCISVAISPSGRV